MPAPKRTPKATILVEFSYDGCRFHGLQCQPGLTTVAGALLDYLEQQLAQPLGAQSFAARTDAGVSAEQNFLTLRVSATADLTQRLARLQGRSPTKGLWILRAASVPRSVNARNCAVSKRYRYAIQDESGESGERLDLGVPDGRFGRLLGATHALPAAATRALPAEANVSEATAGPWRVAQRLDVSRMQDASKMLIGTHDFSSFRARGCAAKSPVKTLHSLNVERRENQITIDVTGDAFLRKMVRIICRCLTEVGAGLRTPSEIEGALRHPQPTPCTRPAPARALTLLQVVMKRFEDVRDHPRYR